MAVALVPFRLPQERQRTRRLRHPVWLWPEPYRFHRHQRRRGARKQQKKGPPRRQQALVPAFSLSAPPVPLLLVTVPLLELVLPLVLVLQLVLPLPLPEVRRIVLPPPSPPPPPPRPLRGPRPPGSRRGRWRSSPARCPIFAPLGPG